MPARRRAFSVHVTLREAEILNLLAQGLSNAEISATTGIAMSTVKHHICQAAVKLDLHSRVLLAKFWSYEIFRRGAGQGGPVTQRRRR
jgi:DNA-binding NarL/FixJ family response regulator